MPLHSKQKNSKKNKVKTYKKPNLIKYSKIKRIYAAASATENPGTP